MADPNPPAPSEAPELTRALNVVLEFAQRRTLGKLPALIAEALLLAAERDLAAVKPGQAPSEAVARLRNLAEKQLAAIPWRRDALALLDQLESALAEAKELARAKDRDELAALADLDAARQRIAELEAQLAAKDARLRDISFTWSRFRAGALTREELETCVAVWEARDDV